MSGGAFNYAYFKLENLQQDVFEHLLDINYEMSDAETLMIGKLLKELARMAKITKAVEWHFSYDSLIETVEEVEELFNKTIWHKIESEKDLPPHFNEVIFWHKQYGSRFIGRKDVLDESQVQIRQIDHSDVLCKWSEFYVWCEIPKFED